jgi:hypothetical protein
MVLTQAVDELRKEQQRLQAELDRVAHALNVLNALGGEGRGQGKVGNGRRRPRRKMKPAARARIAAAQRARWAKVKWKKRGQVEVKHGRKS